MTMTLNTSLEVNFSASTAPIRLSLLPYNHGDRSITPVSKDTLVMAPVSCNRRLRVAPIVIDSSPANNPFPGRFRVSSPTIAPDSHSLHCHISCRVQQRDPQHRTRQRSTPGDPHSGRLP